MKKYILNGLVALIVVFGACSRPEHQHQEQGWKPNTEKLDEFVGSKPEVAGFAHDVKMFYENLHNARWAETYSQRDLAFQKFFPQQLYLKLASQSGWRLDDYEVLSLEMHNTNKIILICKFIEGPLPHTSYNTVTWTLDNGTWRCDRAGPNRLAIFFEANSSNQPK